VASAGYSGIPLHRKLGLAAGRRVYVASAPASLATLLAGAPADLGRSRACARIRSHRSETARCGLVVDVKVCAIDATWSGLKFVRRVRDRTTSGQA